MVASSSETGTVSKNGCIIQMTKRGEVKKPAPL